MEKKIEHPKIFISYAWTSPEYEERVMNFASRLQSDGVEVLIDKWIMHPGSDTIDFMEQCVKDESVNFVLMLLDKNYTLKANKRKGGVGIETQIISSEVYNDVNQKKFIPIVFERDSDGKIYVPIYLKSRFHYDFTQKDIEEKYIMLVKQIYGREIYDKPILGEKPAWVDDSTGPVNPLKFKVLNSQDDENFFEQLFIDIKNANLGDEISSTANEDEVFIRRLEIYKNSIIYRNILLDIFIRNYDNNEFVDDTCDFYEKIINWNRENTNLIKEIWDAFIHETFIYLIAILFKNRKYSKINKFISKSYFDRNEIVTSNRYFYSHGYYNIEIAKNKLDDKKYYSPLAQLWIENIYEPKINKEEFTAADLLIYNLSILLLEEQSWYWFPVSYVYSGNSRYNSSLTNVSLRLKSKYELEKMYDLFGINTTDAIRQLFSKMQKFTNDKQERYRYSGSFETAELFLDFIKIEEIGTYN